MSASVDLQPGTDEVLQVEADEDEKPYIPPLCVKEIQAPVRAQVLPRKGAATFTKTVGTSPVQLLRADHWRGRTVLVGDGPFLVAFSEASCQSESAMAAWPADTPLELSATVEVWALVPVDTAAISVITERWAEGE